MEWSKLSADERSDWTLVPATKKGERYLADPSRQITVLLTVGVVAMTAIMTGLFVYGTFIADPDDKKVPFPTLLTLVMAVYFFIWRPATAPKFQVKKQQKLLDQGDLMAVSPQLRAAVKHNMAEYASLEGVSAERLLKEHPRLAHSLVTQYQDDLLEHYGNEQYRLDIIAAIKDEVELHLGALDEERQIEIESHEAGFRTKYPRRSMELEEGKGDTSE